MIINTTCLNNLFQSFNAHHTSRMSGYKTRPVQVFMLKTQRTRQNAGPLLRLIAADFTGSLLVLIRFIR